jgi:hypothetical protein
MIMNDIDLDQPVRVTPELALVIARTLSVPHSCCWARFGFEVHRVALTPDQVRGLGPPSTPLKDTEHRADKRQARTDTKQTEIDAAIALRPAELAQLAREAISPFFDATLDDRFGSARRDWLAEAQQVIDDHLDGDREQVMATARDKLSQARALVDGQRVPADQRGAR